MNIYKTVRPRVHFHRFWSLLVTLTSPPCRHPQRWPRTGSKIRGASGAARGGSSDFQGLAKGRRFGFQQRKASMEDHKVQCAGHSPHSLAGDFLHLPASFNGLPANHCKSKPASAQIPKNISPFMQHLDCHRLGQAHCQRETSCSHDKLPRGSSTKAHKSRTSLGTRRGHRIETKRSG